MQIIHFFSMKLQLPAIKQLNYSLFLHKLCCVTCLHEVELRPRPLTRPSQKALKVAETGTPPGPSTMAWGTSAPTQPASRRATSSRRIPNRLLDRPLDDQHLWGGAGEDCLAPLHSTDPKRRLLQKSASQAKTK